MFFYKCNNCGARLTFELLTIDGDISCPACDWSLMVKVNKEEGIGRRAIVLQIENRFFCGFGKTGRIMTAWSLSGAKLFGEWRESDILTVEERLVKKGKKTIRKLVYLDPILLSDDEEPKT